MTRGIRQRNDTASLLARKPQFEVIPADSSGNCERSEKKVVIVLTSHPAYPYISVTTGRSRTMCMFVTDGAGESRAIASELNRILTSRVQRKVSDQRAVQFRKRPPMEQRQFVRFAVASRGHRDENLGPLWVDSLWSYVHDYTNLHFRREVMLRLAGSLSRSGFR